MTNDFPNDSSNGVLHEAPAVDTPVTEPDDGGILALEALKVAAVTADSPEATTARAQIYLDWLKQNG